ncbi:MAG: putative C-S lyase [Gammaproteobacteria bacterium]|nr:putative C-S lyase [Gammaproteobacteria bacterium]NIW85414.1 putative C-S lyase [Gammaproteobacteria bacterium]
MPTETGTSEFDVEIDRTNTSSSKWDKYAGRDVLPFWVADMDFAMPSFIQSAIAERLAHPVLGYTRTPDAAVAAFQNWLKRSFGWDVPEEWLVWIPGVVTGFNLAARAVAEPGGSVLIPTPVYYPFLSTPRHAGQDSIEVPLVSDGDRWTMDFDAMGAACRTGTRLFMLSNPQNPTGRAYTEEELSQLAAFCLRHDLYLCSDEIHASILLAPDARHVPVAALGPEIAERTISLYAATKTYNIPGLGCAVAVIADARLRRDFRRAMAGLVPGIGPLAYAASTAAFADTSDWTTRLTDYLRGNHQRVRDVVGDRMTPVEATYLAWIDLTDLGFANPAARLEDFGIGLSEGADFGGSGYVRFNFACPRSLLDRGLARFQDALARLQGSQGAGASPD